MLLASLRANIAATVFGGLAAVFALIAVVQTVRLNGFLWFDGATDKLEDCIRDRNELRAAAKEAERKNREQVARIEKEQQEITDDIEIRYKDDRERLQRELAVRLRNPVPKGSPAGPKASPNGAATEKPDETARVCIPPSDYVHGAETELQLDTLITWVEEQLRVER